MSTPQQDLIDTLTDKEFETLVLNTPISDEVLGYWNRQPIAALENIIRAVKRSLNPRLTGLSREARDSLFGDGTK